MTTPKTEHTQRAEGESARAKEPAAHGDGAQELHANAEKKSTRAADPSSVKAKPGKNNVRNLRMERMMSKAELARRAGLSTLTIDRVERGMACRMDTKRKILEALGLTPSDRVKVFGDDD
jgi:DNA-binding XRE family transcriptional regulator